MHSMSTSRTQFGTLFAHPNGSYILTRAGKVSLPKQVARDSTLLADMLTYVSNVAVDEHGQWTLGSIDGPWGAILYRTIYTIETGVLRGKSGEDFAIHMINHRGADMVLPLACPFPNFDFALAATFKHGFYIDQATSEMALTPRDEQPTMNQTDAHVRLWRPAVYK